MMKSRVHTSDRPSRITLLALTTAVLALVMASVLFAADHEAPATFGSVQGAPASVTVSE
jgi:hypothetical protein